MKSRLKANDEFSRPACFFVKPFLDLNHNGDCLFDVEPFGLKRLIQHLS